MKKNVYPILLILFITSLVCVIIGTKIFHKSIIEKNKEKSSSLATDVIEYYSQFDNHLNHDKTIDKNIRYSGTDINNYVLFNNELWRIIGVFNNVETKDGKKRLLKIVRNESIGKYSWSASDENIYYIYNGFGINDWYKSDLMKLLNEGAYFNRTEGNCYVGKNKTEVCDFKKTGLNKYAKDLIEEVKWNLGTSNTNTLKSDKIYKKEHDTKKIDERKTYWYGYVGLISPSDYGYASHKCSDNTALNNYDIEACNVTNYLFNKTENDKTEYLWTMMSDHKYGYKVYTAGKILSLTSTYESRNVYPVLYLKENIKIIGGTGYIDDPYQLAYSSMK